MKRIAQVVGIILLGALGMGAFQVGAELYDDWQFLRALKLQILKQQLESKAHATDAP